MLRASRPCHDQKIQRGRTCVPDIRCPPQTKLIIHGRSGKIAESVMIKTQEKVTYIHVAPQGSCPSQNHRGTFRRPRGLCRLAGEYWHRYLLARRLHDIPELNCQEPS